MKTMNKVILGALTLLSSNFAFAENLLIKAENVPQNTLLDIFMKAPLGFILFIAFLFFFGKHFSK